MKLTKYNHACVVIKHEGEQVIIDPGVFVTALPDISNLSAVIITHQHPDHFSPEHVRSIVAANPNIEIFAAPGIADQLDDIEVTTVVAGENAAAGAFTFRFFGSEHALIHKTIPRIANIGVLVNESIYYPGDSFEAPDCKPKVALTPTSGPWLKVGEVIDFLDKVQPGMCVPTHNALQSELGDSMLEQWLADVCNKHHIAFKHVPPGESIEI